MSRLLVQFVIVAGVFAVVILGSMPAVMEARRDAEINDYPNKLNLEDMNAQRRWQMVQTQPAEIDNYIAAADEMASVYLRQQKFNEAVDIYQKEMGATWGLKANAYNELWVNADIKAGGVHRDLCAFDTALICYNSALDHDRKYLPAGDARIARDLNNIGLMHYMIGLSKSDDKDRKPEFEKAVDFYKQALKIASAAEGKKTLQAASLWNLYLACRDSGDKAAANDYKKQAQAIDTTMHRICKAP
ncbi:MAG: tetratricopeptide repeat protein [Cyanobacteria bacterium REEB67]|nr:tetratricopeptide repeat protein [Cyanobacteria bacterium REEB67]